MQELAFTLSNGIAYVEAAAARGLEVDRFGARLSFFFNAHNHLFEEVAKFRAARRMWARIMRERFHAKNPRCLAAALPHADRGFDAHEPAAGEQRGAGRDPGARGGPRRNAIIAYQLQDEALSLPSEEAVRTALRTQQILAHESGVADTVDPLGGAPFVERLTDELESRAEALMKEVAELGGSVAAIEKGFVQREIHRSAMQVAARRRERQADDRWGQCIQGRARPTRRRRFRVDGAAIAEVKRSLDAARKRRDAKKTNDALEALEGSARDANANLLPPIAAAVEVVRDGGEICERLERVFGKYRPPAVF